MGITGVRPLGFDEFTVISARLLTDERSQVVVERHHVVGVLRHLDFDLVVSGMRVAEHAGDLGAKGQNLFESLDILRATASFEREPGLLACGLDITEVLDRQELRVGHIDEVDAVRLVELTEVVLGQAREFLAREHDARVVLTNGFVELDGERREFLLHRCELVTMLLRQVHSGAAIVAERVLEEPLSLTGQARVRVGVGANGVEDVFVLGEIDEPVAHVLTRTLSVGADGRIRRDVRHELHHVRIELELGDQVIERPDGGVEGVLARRGVDDRRHGRLRTEEGVTNRRVLRHGGDGTRRRSGPVPDGRSGGDECGDGKHRHRDS